jgi:glutamate/tyrosine decarboxylase-like PLP-dependent enzyme
VSAVARPAVAGLRAGGRSREDVLADLAARREHDLALHGGSAWAYVYDSGLAELEDLTREVYGRMLSINGLDPTAFPSTVSLENDVVGTVTALLGGGPEHAGTFTSGGTESITLAVKAARDSHPEIARPRLVKATTGHPAFHKAAHYLGVEVVNVPVDPVTYRADPAAIAAAIDADTVLVVASAVSYPHGVLDPIEEIAAAASARGVLCHVDACVGGFLLPFQRALGEPLPPFDLSVGGVTSISADLHKYGYAPKGASVVVFADAELRRAAYFAAADWPGYTVVNSAVQSTKSAGPVAAAWATLQHLGHDGYVALTRQSRDALRGLVTGVEGIDGLRVLGDPIATFAAVAGEDGVDVFLVADELRELGLYAQVQLSYDGSPGNLHLSTFGSSPEHVDRLVDGLREAVARARAADPVAVPPELGGALAGLNPDDLTAEVFAGFVAAVGVDLSSGTPGRMAFVNHVLDAAPIPLRERLLERFLGVLFTPSSD